jgi:putative flippase GtrA
VISAGPTPHASRRHLAWRYVKFMIAAGMSVPFNIGSRILFSLYFPFVIAIVLSQFVGMIVAFVLTRAFVFRSSRARRIDEFIRFAGVNVVSLAVTWVVSVAFLYGVLPAIGDNAMPELTAHVIGLLTSSLTAFFGHRHYTFRESHIG